MKTLAEMTAEIKAVNQDKGWLEGEHTFGELIALLHSEVSEALEAYRYWGLEDHTNHLDAPGAPLPKPEGVGSELADVLIRLLDLCSRYNVDLETKFRKLNGLFLIPETFGDQLALLHFHISMAHWASYFGEAGDDRAVPDELAKVYVLLAQISEHNGIDLRAEYERKLAYNWTRPYRHGGKKL